MFINQNRNHYNQHIFANKKYLYSRSVKIRASKFIELLEILHPAGCGSIFLAKVIKILREVGSRLVRGQEYGGWGKTSRSNSFNFWSIGCVTCGQVLLWRIGPVCWPMPAAGVEVFGVSQWFAEHTKM